MCWQKPDVTKPLGQYATMKFDFLAFFEEGKHTLARTILDAQLREMKTTVLEIGTLASCALDLALQTLRSGDQVLCNQVIASDKTIDDLRFQAEKLTFRILALQQPIFGRDTRFLSSIHAIAAD